MYRPSHNTFYTKALFNLGHGRIEQETMPDLTSPKTQGFRSDLLWDRTSIEGDARSLIGSILLFFSIDNSAKPVIYNIPISVDKDAFYNKCW